MRNEEFWKKLVIYGARGFSRVLGLFFKCHFVLRVRGKEVFCRHLLLVGRIELDQTRLRENFLQREERGQVGLGFPFCP